ncbi:MAG: ATP phosphoribosyltransferase [Chloroflexi bacterium]|nr:ATP phosphoribosyltransferase [Chloroflexota bacterium]
MDRSIRIALPSKGLLAEGSKKLLADVGLSVYSPNPRQYIALIPSLPGIEVIFQRPSDIVISVRDGSVDFGITGRDVFLEKDDSNGRILELHSRLGFGKCSLNVIVPDAWAEINAVDDLVKLQGDLGRALKIATKFPRLTTDYFQEYAELEIKVIRAEGTIEIAPTVGYADLVVDLVSTGTTLRDNRLKILDGGKIIDSQACLISNKNRLQVHEETLEVATHLLELIGAYLTATENLAVFANIRGESPEVIAAKIFKKDVLRGLQGPTISKILNHTEGSWYAIHLIVQKTELQKAIRQIREVGGSGVVVCPINYIFEEEPLELSRMHSALEK